MKKVFIAASHLVIRYVERGALSTRSPEVVAMCAIRCMDLYVPGLLLEIRFHRVILLR